MNETFIFAIIRFIKGDYAKRMSVEIATRITDLGTYYIQFKTFTYLRVEGRMVNPKKLPRYLFDRLILLEIARQLIYIWKSEETK